MDDDFGCGSLEGRIVRLESNLRALDRLLHEKLKVTAESSETSRKELDSRLAGMNGLHSQMIKMQEELTQASVSRSEWSSAHVSLQAELKSIEKSLESRLRGIEGKIWFASGAVGILGLILGNFLRYIEK